MRRVAMPMSLLATILSGGIFGFFYAWVCSTMWGLDAIDPRVAIEAMQAMNASVRNPVFFPVFFLTPVALAMTTVIAIVIKARTAALWFGSASACNAVFVIVITAQFNVPLNEALAAYAIPETSAEAADLWSAYSGQWQVWNTARAAGSGLALLFALLGLLALAQKDARHTQAVE